jgi:iron complex outermembrane receptor protein
VTPFARALVVSFAVSGLATRASPARADDEAPDEVEVRGAPVSPASAPKDPSVAGSTVRRSELVGPGRSAADALRGEVGLSVTESGGLGAAATASVRGATAAQTPVYLAGVRINDEVTGAADLSTLPLWLIDHVEIYRGNAPPQADRLGLGGAIFFEPIRPREPLAGLGVMGGSHGSRAASAFAATGGEDRGLLVGARLEGADNDYRFLNDRGTLFVDSDDFEDQLENADATLLDLWALGHARVGAGRTELVLNHFEREQGVARLALVPTHASRQRSGRSLAALTATAPLDIDDDIEARTALVVTRTTLDDPLRELGLGTDRVGLRGERLDQHLGTRVGVARGATLGFGLDASPERLRRYEGTGPSAEDALLDARRLFGRVSGYGVIDVLSGVSVRPLVALECHETDASTAVVAGARSGCDALEPTGRLGALGVFGELSAFASAGRYVRVPTLGELYGMSAVVRGEPRLESETGATLDAGVRFTRGLDGEVAPLVAAASAYVRRSNDLIAFKRTAQGYVVPENVGEARVMGLELEAGLGFLRHFSLDTALTAVDPRDRTPDRPYHNDVLPFQSKLVVASGLFATSGPTGLVWAEVLALRIRHLYQSSRYSDHAGLRVIPEQHSLDLDGSIAALDGGLVLRARVANLFDTARYDVVGFPLPGRSFFMSLEARPR